MRSYEHECNQRIPNRNMLAKSVTAEIGLRISLAQRLTVKFWYRCVAQRAKQRAYEWTNAKSGTLVN